MRKDTCLKCPARGKRNHLCGDCHFGIHHWFNLTYASYYVMPRSVLQSMPNEWQRQWVALQKQLYERYNHLDLDSYAVLKRDDKTGRFHNDDLANYDRGRRYIEPKIMMRRPPTKAEKRALDKIVKRLKRLKP